MNKPIQLETPIVRDGQKITELTLTKPNAGALRGVTLMAIAQMDVMALETVLPRVSNPTLTAHEVRNMDPADLMALGVEVAGFLLPKSALTDSPSE